MWPDRIAPAVFAVGVVYALAMLLVLQEASEPRGHPPWGAIVERLVNVSVPFVVWPTLVVGCFTLALRWGAPWRLRWLCALGVVLALPAAVFTLRTLQRSGSLMLY